MSVAATERSPSQWIRGTIGVFVTLAGASVGITLLYLGMRGVMRIGGFCAEGGAFEIRQHCPEGIPGLMFGGIWGGLIFVGLYLWQTSKYDVPSLVMLSWSALFLSLGYNFLDFGLDPVPPLEGLQWGWLVCAIVFGLMGGLPLIALGKPLYRNFFDPGTKGAWGGFVGTGSVSSKVATKVASTAAVRVAAATPSPATAEPPGVGDAGGLVGYLERLQYLHKSGSLSDEEFAAAKKRVLEGDA